MKIMEVEGGHKLSGTIRVSGAKNATVAIIPAAILTDEEVTICNIPDLYGNEALGCRSVADDGVHMGNFTDGGFQILLLPDGHALRDEQRESAFAEILQENILAPDGLQILGQIIQQVVLGSGGSHPKPGRDQQEQADDDDQRPMLHQPASESFHNGSSNH